MCVVSLNQSKTMNKIYRREDGSRVQIRARFYTQGSYLNYHVDCSKCEKGKRKFISAVDHYDYSWRALDAAGRANEDMRRNLTIVSKKEIQEVCEMLWNSLKPDADNLD